MKEYTEIKEHCKDAESRLVKKIYYSHVVIKPLFIVKNSTFQKFFKFQRKGGRPKVEKSLVKCDYCPEEREAFKITGHIRLNHLNLKAIVREKEIIFENQSALHFYMMNLT